MIYLTFKYGPAVWGENASNTAQGLTQRQHTSADKERKDRGQAPFFSPSDELFVQGGCRAASGMDGWKEGGTNRLREREG